MASSKSWKDIAKSLFTPVGQQAEAYMDKRKKKLDTISGKQQGGVFDMIYKKKKEREAALEEID